MGSDRQGQDDEQTIHRCKEIFSAFDKDGDGCITELELGALLRSLGVKPNAEQVEALFSRGDRDKNGLIDFGEFLQLVRGGSGSSPSEEQSGSSGSPQAEGGEEDVTYKEEELVALFKAFDKDGNGYITAAELAHSMARMGRRLSFRELADMMAEADLDGDGRISFEEFVSTLSGRSLLLIPRFHVVVVFGFGFVLSSSASVVIVEAAYNRNALFPVVSLRSLPKRL